METVASVIFMNSPFPTIDFVLSEPRLRMIKKKKKKKKREATEATFTETETTQIAYSHHACPWEHVQ